MRACEMSHSFCSAPRFYVKDSIVPFEEDYTHEFKGHRNISVEEVPPWCYIPGTDRRSRKAVSRNINGFLNTGKGGTVYLGIVDEGKVKGIKMTQYQRDHVIISVKDAMSRYTPAVPEDCYRVEIVPVIGGTENIEDVTDIPFSGSEEIDSNRLRPHLLRTSKYCWCDKEAIELFSKGFAAPCCVVEITVFPWKDEAIKAKNGQLKLRLHPIYQDEEGKSYFRRQASLVQYSPQEVVELTLQEIHHQFRPVLLSIKEDIEKVREQLVHLNTKVDR